MTDRAWCYFRCLVQACYREARHVGPPDDDTARCPVTGPYARRYAAVAAKCRANRALLKDTTLWEGVRSARESEVVLGPFVEATDLPPADLPALFRLPFWQRKFGGERWAEIANVMLHLKDAIDKDDDTRAEALCEAARKLKHNTGRLVPEPTTANWNREKWPELCP